MQLADFDPNLVRAAGAALGAVLALGAIETVDRLPARYGITHLVTGQRRSRRNRVLVVLSIASALGIAHVLARTADLPLAHAAFLFAANVVTTTLVMAAAAIDLEHMILPDELTLGGAVLCLATSPLRRIGLAGSVEGAITGLALSYLPLLLYKKIRGQSGMGLGDAKLAVMAGAWHGTEGAVFVLFAGAVQSALAAVALRVFGLRFEVPESVTAELGELRARAEAGDEAAKRALADDPMARETSEGTLGMRLPLGPFLALACVEALFLRRWLVEDVVGWLLR